jgi:hypothetical protein
MKFKSVKIREQPIFIIENNLQKVGQPFFSLVLSDNRGTRSIFFRRQFLLVQDNWTNVNVEA